MTVYLQEARALEATQLGLTGGGKLGEIFSRHTTNPMRRDRAVAFDVSSINEAETDLQATVLLACWSYGFGTVNVANATAGPLVTALTVAIVEAAEKYSTSQPGGWLATPLLGILDEAANVCRWRALPDQYSHYGSRGIILMTILQSWSQGVEVWSRLACGSSDPRRT